MKVINPKLRKASNSIVVAISRVHLQNAGFEQDESVVISSEKGKITITKVVQP